MKDYYKILGISKEATKEEIKQAFRNLSKTMHPDVGGNESEFSLLSEAYKVLSDENTRKYYDQTGRGPTESIDLFKEARLFLSQLIENIITDTSLDEGDFLLDEVYKDCRNRIKARQMDIRFINRSKEQYENKIDIVLIDNEDNIFNEKIKEKINQCEEEIALASLDIKTIEIALDLIKKYYPNPHKNKSPKDILTNNIKSNKDINSLAKKELENEPKDQEGIDYADKNKETD